MTFLAPTLDNAYPHFALVITPCFYLHQVEVVDEDPASGCLNNGLFVIISEGIYQAGTRRVMNYFLSHRHVGMM